MSVAIETIQGLERRVTLSIPKEKIESEKEKRLKEVSQKVKIDGFRPGKPVPLRIVEQRYGKHIHQEVLEDLKRSSLKDALAEANIMPAGILKYEDIQGQPSEPLQVAVTFEVFPSIQLANFSELTLEKPLAKVTDADIDKTVERLRQQHATWQEVKRAAKEGDRLTIDFIGTLDKQSFAGGTAKGVFLTLGSKSMIPGFEEGLVGLMAGEEKVLKLRFPKDYHAAELADKEAEFAVTIHKIEEAILPEVDVDFIKRLGVNEQGGIEGLRKEIRTTLENQLEQALQANLKNQVMDKLLALHPFDIPQSLTQEESLHLRHDAAQRMSQQTGKKLSEDKFPLDLFKEQAKKRVALGLILSELVKQWDIKVDPQKVRAAIEKIAASYQQPEDVINWYYHNQEYLRRVENSVLEEQVVDVVLSKAQVVEKTMDYDEVMANH